MSNDWKARIDTQEELREKKKQQEEEKARTREYEKSPEVVWQRELRKVDLLKCCVCEKTEAQLKTTLRPSTSEKLSFGPMGDETPSGYFRVTGNYLHPQPEALSRCELCADWVCNERCPEPHIYKGTCEKCARKPDWWPFYRWNPFWKNETRSKSKM